MASIEKRSETTYRITVSCGYDKQGKKLFKKKTVSIEPKLTEKQKEKKLNELAVLFEKEVENGTYLDGEKITFGEFAEVWLKDYAEKQLAPKTLFRYKEILNRINKALGHIRLAKLQPVHLIEFYNNLSEPGIRIDRKGDKPLSSATIMYHHRVLSSILATAVHWQLIEINPCTRVKPPKVITTEAKSYDEGQIGDMFVALEKEPLKYQTAIYIAIFGGLRLGEVSALNWLDIDFKEKTLTINKAAQYVPGIGCFDKDPKTEKGKREITLPTPVLDKLKAHRKEQLEEKIKMGQLWEEHNKIFTQANGKPMFPDTPSKWFAKFVKRQSLDKITFHQLRHTHASLLIAQGIDVVAVSKRLGHSKPSTTSDIYSHALSRPDKVAAERLDTLYKNLM